MKKSIVVALLLTVTRMTLLAAAQDESSRFEACGGYDYVRYNASPRVSGVPPSESFNANGLSGQFVYNRSEWLGLTAQLSGYALARHGFATTHQVAYLFGPRINLRRSKIKPFAQVLVGPVWAEDGITFGSVTAFGFTAGGGINLLISQHIAIRPFQVEYFLTKFRDGNSNRQDNFRFGTGIVFRFGMHSTYRR
jgi:hypothetical protein